MDLDAYLQQMLAGPDPAAKKAALAQALAASGLATLAGRNGGGWQGALRSAGQGGLLGMGAYNQAMGDAAQAPAHNLDAIGKVMGLKAQQQQIEDRDAAKQSNAAFAQQLGGVFAGQQGPQLGNMGAGGPTPENAQRVAPPQASPQDRIAQYRRVADMYTQRGDAENAKKFDDIADRMQEEFSTTPQVVMQGGKPTFMQFGKRGTTRAAEGMEPPPDTQMLNLGGRMQAVDKRTVAPGATFDVTMDPAQKDASARGWAGIGLDREKFGYQQSADKVTTGQKAGDLVSGLRKEFNALQPVQNYRAALPVVESAKNAPDTPAGDLDLIYAVGKALDPNSVVREGELNLVIKSGSPLQRFAGYAQYIGAGKGRLPAAQRAELIAMLDGRVGQLKGAHDMAAAPYIKQAQALGLPMDQIFQEEKSSSKAIRSGGPAVGTVVDGHRFKGGDPNNQANWERMK